MLGMLVGVLLPRQADREAKMTRPRQFMVGEGLGNPGPKHHQSRERLDVDRFLKSDEHLFFGNTNLKIAPEWIDSARAVLTHMGCAQEF